MQMSTIKLPACDFSDLQITDELENRPGTRQFLTLPCVVTNRSGTSRRLYILTPAGIFRDKPGTVRMKQVFKCIHGLHVCRRFVFLEKNTSLFQPLAVRLIKHRSDVCPIS